MFFGGVKGLEFTIHNIDSAGTPRWEKIYKTVNPTMNSTYGLVTVDSSKNFFFNLEGDAVALLDDMGTPVVAKNLSIPAVNLSGYAIGVLPDNKKVMLLADQSTYQGNGYMIVCLSPDLSTVIWSRHFSGQGAYFRELSVIGNKIFASGSYNDLVW